MFTGNIPNERLGFPQDSFLADFQVSSVEIENDDGSKTGKATVHISYQSSNYEMLVNMKDGKKEGDGLILYANGTLFMKLKFVNDLAEGIVLKKEQNGRTILRGELEHGKECSVFEEYDSSRNVTWRGFYQNGKRYSGQKKDFYDYLKYLQEIADLFGTYIIRVKDDSSGQNTSPFAANGRLRPLGKR